MDNQIANQIAAPEWWSPLRECLAERLHRHRENQRIASGKRLPKECREWFKQARAEKIIPGKTRADEVAPRSFFSAYERLLSLDGTLEDDDDYALGGIAVWFGSREGILTKQETKRLAELEQSPRGWLRPRVLAITRSGHEQLKRDRPKLLEGAEVMEISEDDERECLRLQRKRDEARVTEICFTPAFDTGRMTAMLCDPVPDDLLRKECSRAGRKLWHASPGGPPVSGKPAEEVVAQDVAARLKQNPPGELPAKYKAGITWTDFAKLEPKRLTLAGKVAVSIERNQSMMQGVLGSAAGKIYRCASPEAVRVLNECLKLANKHQRPPTRGELRNAVKWPVEAIKEFTALLREVGLAWLKEDHAAKGKQS